MMPTQPSSTTSFLRRSLPVLVLAACATGALARAWTPAVPANDAIEQAMGQINRSMKTLGRGISEETRDDALGELAKIEEALMLAKVQTPDTAEAVDEKKRAAFVSDYRKTLIEALKFACDAETAVLDGKYKDAEGILRGKLGALKSQGHDKFKGQDR